MDQERILRSLETDGIALLGKIIDDDALARMQDVYKRALERPSWNTWIGFEQNEKWRRLVENVLLYDKAFLDLPLRPDITTVLEKYIGPEFELTEARGWETVATKRDFHGWHADAWCSPDLIPPPREVKLGCYLTDVNSGHFQYMKGTHRGEEAAREYPDREVEHMKDLIVDAKGGAGSCFLFDTSGIHRQSIPVLKKRWVIMYNYHNPDVPMGDFATGYGRYRPHMLSACFLGSLTVEQQRILGFNRKPPDEGFHPAERRFPATHSLVQLITRMTLEYQDFAQQLRRVKNAIHRRIPGL
jgi:hypothetical protein